MSIQHLTEHSDKSVVLQSASTRYIAEQTIKITYITRCELCLATDRTSQIVRISNTCLPIDR